MKEYRIQDKKITIYLASAHPAPVIYLNTVIEEGPTIYDILKNSTAANFTLVTISGLDWNHDMALWDCPAIAKNIPPCTGGALEYLTFLQDKVIPTVEKEIRIVPMWRGIAGYSLAGLFALYTLYQADVFSRAACISGSLWFPGFREYVFSQKTKGNPEHIYFSLGNKENRTRNPYLKTVEENTKVIEEYFRKSGVDTIFQLNPGNHYNHSPERTAAGIQWILER